MDTMRGNFGSSDFPDESVDFDLGEDENIRDLPPAAIGQDERRMQVRAYNHWAGMLGERNFPAAEELEPQNLEDFGPYSVLLDFSQGIEDPAVQYLGDQLAEECGAVSEIGKLSEVPSRSLLSRITDHYMQILANQAPIGFEAEFVNQRDVTILYRGILLPFSSDNETIDFIYGVINWKEMADAAKADELLLEIDQALETDQEEGVVANDQPLTLTDLAPANDEEGAMENAKKDDGSANSPWTEEQSLEAQNDSNFAVPTPWSEDHMPSIEPVDGEGDEYDFSLPTPAFGDFELGEDEGEDEDEANYSFASLTDHVDLPSGKSKALDLDELSAQQALDPEAPEVSYDDGSFDHSVGDAAPGNPEFDANPIEDAPIEDMPFEGAPFGEADEPLEFSNGAIVDPTQPFDEEEDQFDNSESVGEDSSEIAYVPLTNVTPKPLRKPLLEPVDSLENEGVEEAAEEGFAQEELPEDAGLYDYLAAARELAHVANDSEDRSRVALYAAVGRAFDVALAADESPEEYNDLLAENGLVAQDRAPMTPVVKLVFGADYDKTRLTEYATVLGHARRIGLEHGQLQEFLSVADGGLKGVVQTERRLRREEAGQEVEPTDQVRNALAEKLRELESLQLSDLDPDGAEFGLVMIRRTEDGEIVVLGELEQDIPLIERSARKIMG